MSEENELKSELGSIDLELYRLIEKARKAGFQIWLTIPHHGEFVLGEGGDIEFELVRK